MGNILFRYNGNEMADKVADQVTKTISNPTINHKFIADKKSFRFGNITGI